MGGQEGNRGYLVQAVIALLRSLEEGTWGTLTIEPDDTSEKVDVRWNTNNRSHAVQIKSSKNQIGRADAQRWAAELKSSCVADSYELILLGPAAQSVIETKSFDGVSIPCPKSLDFRGLLDEAAHLLDKFFARESISQQSPQMREVVVRALVTELSRLSTMGKPLSRPELIELLIKWIKSVGVSPDHPWEQVDFENQRGIENAVAGKRLGPLDVDVCPAFSVGDEITKELQRSHVYELAGTSGCGKSITAWQVARRFQRSGYRVWRPRTFATAQSLLSEVPGKKSLLIIDDAHKYGPILASRLSELSGLERKVLLVSTVENTLLSQVICLAPEKCVQELVAGLAKIGDALLPIVQQYDDRIGNRSGEMSFEVRLADARKQKKPWEVFWIIRGGWLTARREIDGIQQFPGATEVLLWIATAQIVSCDAGVPRETLITGLRDVGITEKTASSALQQLERLGLVLCEDSIRTKHLVYANQVLEVCFHESRSENWSKLAPIVTRCALGAKWSLKGLAWLLGQGLGQSNAIRFRKQDFRVLLEPLMTRCLAEQEDLAWASGCAARLIGAFDLSAEEILAHADRWQAWATSGNALAAYFCGAIVNTLINKSPHDQAGYREILSRPLVERIDANRLVEIVNTIPLEDFYSYAHLLDRMCFSKPSWAASFLQKLNWDRIRAIILGASSDHAYAIDAMIGCLVKLASSRDRFALDYVESIVPYISRAINDNPSETVRNMHDVFWMCLPYGPKFLMGGRVPDSRQRRLAKLIVNELDPRAISAAMEKAVSRDLEGLAWTLDFVREVDTEFVTRVVETLNHDVFFTATATDWKEQTRELQQLLRFFALGKDFEPASDWVRANSELISGPLHPLFVLLAPDVAIKFHLRGKGLRLVRPYQAGWSDTFAAIVSLAKFDREQCKNIITQNFEELWGALYDLSLDSLHHLVQVFKVLFELSPDLFARFVDGIDLDNERCLELIQQLRGTQPKELLMYRKLARSGTKVRGKLGTLSAEFLSRLNA